MNFTFLLLSLYTLFNSYLSTIRTSSHHSPASTPFPVPRHFRSFPSIHPSALSQKRLVIFTCFLLGNHRSKSTSDCAYILICCCTALLIDQVTTCEIIACLWRSSNSATKIACRLTVVEKVSRPLEELPTLPLFFTNSNLATGGVLLF